MKIYCDFCGSQIETTENKTCPHCGGYYSLDKELLDEKERVKRLNELDMEKKELELEQLRRTNEQPAQQLWSPENRSPAKGCLAAVIVGLSIFGLFFILMIVCIFMEEAETKDTHNSTKKAAETTARTSYSYSFDIDFPEIPELNVDDLLNQ